MMRNIAILLFILVVGTASVWGADKTFTATNGNWNVASNWSPSVIPANTDHVIIPNGKTVTVTGNVQCAKLEVQTGGKLIISGNVEILVSRNNNSDKSDYIVIDGTLSFENGATLEAKSNGGSSKDQTVIQANGVITGEGAFKGTNFVLSPDADYSGFTPTDGCSDAFKNAYDKVINTITNTSVYLFSNTSATINHKELFTSSNTIAYKDPSKSSKYTSRIYFDKQTIYVQEGEFTFNCEPDVIIKKLNINSSSTVNVATGKGTFNGSGTLTITAELPVSNSGETNTFASEASGSIFTSGTVRVTNPNWGDAAPRFYIGNNTDWTSEKNWSIDANRNIYYWRDGAYYYPGKSDNNGVAHIAAGKSVTLSGDLAYPIGITTYGSVTLGGNISLGGSNKLIAYPGSNVTVNSTITRTNADQIIVYHTYSNSASFYKGSSGNIGVDNKLNVRHKIKGGRVYYMGASTEDGDYSMPAGTREFYDAATEEFTSGIPTSGTHRTGTVKLSAAGTISETGSVPFSDKTYTLKKAEGKFGWNLLCNPFTTGVSLSSLTAEDGAVEPTVWVRVKDGSSYGFVTYSISTGVSSPAGGSDIAPQQAFFVKAKYNEASFTVKYPSSGASGAQLKSASIVPDDVLRLTISSEGCNTDEVALVFRDGGALGLIRGDSEKRGESATYNALFAMKDGVQCVIPYYPEVGAIAGEELPLGFRLSSKSTKGIITATNLEEFGVANDIYLVDKQENVVVNLTEDMSYEFTSEAGKENTGRFAIVIGGKEQEENSDESIATGIENIKAENTLVFNSEGVVVNLARGDRATLRVYDSVGKLVKSVMVKKQETIVPIQGRGLYIAELVTEEGAVRAKALVK